MLLEILADPTRQRGIVRDELGAIVDKFGDDRRTHILHGFDGDMSVEDLIPEEEMVVTVTHGGYIKRVPLSAYRAQNRGGKGRAARRSNIDFNFRAICPRKNKRVTVFSNRGDTIIFFL